VGAAALIPIVACTQGSDARTGEASGVYGGTIVISTSADADILFPPLTLSVQGKQIGDQIFQAQLQTHCGFHVALQHDSPD